MSSFTAEVPEHPRYGSASLLLGNMRLNGMPAPSLRGLAILDGLCGAGVDAAHALVALRLPLGFSILQGDGGRRAIPGARPASVAAVRDKKWLGSPGKSVEPKVGHPGFHPGQRPLMHAIHPLAVQDLLGYLLQCFPDRGNLFLDHCVAVGV